MKNFYTITMISFLKVHCYYSPAKLSGHCIACGKILKNLLRGDYKMAARGRKQKRASYSEILERHWTHTLQAKPLRRGKTLTPPHIQPAQRISTSS
jgi:hypothetical protein